MIHLLRLCNSNDTYAGVPEQLRAGAIASDLLAAAAGEPVDTVSRVIWPDPTLPDLVDRWLDRYQPDVVSLKINTFWFAHESVPLKLERRFGSIGKVAGSAGRKAVGVPWVSRGRFFRLLNRVALRTIGGETYFTPDEVMATMEACVRRVLAREHVVLVVRGTEGGREHPELSRRAFARYDERRRDVNARMAALCGDLSIPYVGHGSRRSKDDFRRRAGADGFHNGTEGQRLVGIEEGEVLAAA
ncbi:MAG: hypothetical protein IT304_10320, partial [Dehalococcoidia bacterium]|nr:hypothetical protein [Dehalococcoidia bacterium]